MAEGGEEEKGLVIKEEYFKVPVAALNTGIRNILSDLDLDIRIIDPDTGLTPDWRGLAELMGFLTAGETTRVGQRDGSRLNVLLTDWTTSPDNSVGNLVTYILRLRRFDVLGRLTNAALDADIEEYKKMNAAVFTDSKPASLWAVGSHHGDPFGPLVTVGDVENGKPVTYDAFVCFDLKDLDFVKLMLEKLEKEPHNMTFCVCPRDLLAGTAEHSVTAMLIEKRCKKLVLVYSPNSEVNKEVDYIIKFTHALSLEPGACEKRIVPLNLGGVGKYHMLNYVKWLNYSKEEQADWFWPILIASLKAPTEYPVSLHQNIQTSSEEEAALDRACVRASGRENGKNKTTTVPSSTNQNATTAAASLVLPVPHCGNGKNASPPLYKPPSPHNQKGQRLQPTEDKEQGERPSPPATGPLSGAGPSEGDHDTSHNQQKDKDTKPPAKPNKPQKRFKFPFCKGQ